MVREVPAGLARASCSGTVAWHRTLLEYSVRRRNRLLHVAAGFALATVFFALAAAFATLAVAALARDVAGFFAAGFAAAFLAAGFLAAAGLEAAGFLAAAGLAAGFFAAGWMTAPRKVSLGFMARI